MAAHVHDGVLIGASIGLMLMSATGFAATPKELKGGIQTIYQASGARNGGGVTTMVTCTNLGSAAGTIGVALYNFDSVSAVCENEYSSVNPGETRTFSVSPVASMVNGLNCPVPTVINQGRLKIIADQQYTLRFVCTASLVSVSGDPPTTLTRLTLYGGAGALLRDVIFADGVEP